jgi:Tfp pilus assembly protein PilF
MVKKFLLAAVLAFGFAGSNANAQGSNFPGITANDGMNVNDMLRAAQAALNKHDNKRAAELYINVLKADPTNVTAHWGCAFICNDEKDYETALKVAKKGLEIDPNSDAIIVEAGYAKWKLGDAANAKKLLVAALEINMKNKAAYAYLIELLKEEGNHADAAKVAAIRDQNIGS